MFRVLILFLWLPLTMAAAWAPVDSRSLSRSRAITPLQAAPQDDNGNVDFTTRRNMLGTAFVAGSLAFFPSVSSSRDRSTARSAWPYAPSPLPSASRTPAELSYSLTVSYEGDDPLASFGAELSGMKALNTNTVVNATLNQAIDQSIKKKQIDPRTHG